MIPYVGDISRADAELLRMLALNSAAILEFGCGASTQVLAAYTAGKVISVDTDQSWIAKTDRNLRRLGYRGKVSFVTYENFESVSSDLIFVDGLNELRLPFALKCWDDLVVGGSLCFHDTRRTEPYGKAELSDVQMVCAVIECHSREIGSVFLNKDASNITIINKRPPLLLEDWAKAEGRTPEQLGIA